MAGRININIATALVMMVTMPMLLEAARYTVPWNNKVKYTQWVKGKPFTAGDFLDFKYDNKTYNVAIVNKDEYQKCKAGSKVDARTTGHDQIKLSQGLFSFISTISKTDCDHGMKLQINVV